MTVEQEIEILPALLVEAMLAHRFFEANQIKKRQEELKKWVRMNQ
jgi:hypothetical protein